MKLLIGGSPCTHWSIAQTKNRETEPSGLGWELFKNYLIAREKYKPDYFLYENNKSMSAAIRAQITKELGVEPVLINSALVSAQNRQRLYWVGQRMPDGTYAPLDIQQPEDLGILLRDVLETVTGEKGYKLDVSCVNQTPNGKSRTVDAHMGKLEHNLVPRMNNPNPAKQQYDCIVETVREEALPDVAAMRQVGRRINEQGHRDDYNEEIPHFQYFEVNENPQKTNRISTVQKDNMVALPVRIGTIENQAKNPEHDSQQYRVYSPDAKSVTICGAGGGGIGAKTGLYAVPVGPGYAGAGGDQTGICGHPARRVRGPVHAEQQNKEGQSDEE